MGLFAYCAPGAAYYSMGDAIVKGKRWIPYAVFIGAALAVGGAASIITQKGMPYYDLALKPSFTPPSALFPIVWTLLYILMGLGMALVWRSGDWRRRYALVPFCAQLAANFLWTLWFFGLRAYGLAFWWLLGMTALVIWMLAAFRRIRSAAGWMQLPYVLWCLFAAALNRAIWLLN